MMILLLFSLILLTACSEKVYVKSKCPYVEPLEFTLHTDVKGGLDAHNTYKAVKALEYYGKETRRLKTFVKGN